LAAPWEQQYRVERVGHSAELVRIAQLPRRDWEPGADEHAARVTGAMRSRDGTMSARPVQGAMLHDLWRYGGLFAPVGVGRGKTLTSLLASSVAVSVRPLLVLPAALVTKTRREWIALAKHWQIPTFLRIVSYQWMGRVGAAGYPCPTCKNDADKKKKCGACEGEGRLGGMLATYKPDLIIFDEAHYVKNPKAAVTRRFDRYIARQRKAGTRLAVAAMSGTMTDKSIKDYAHILRWCLPTGCPIPWPYVDLDLWARALDAIPPDESGAEVESMVHPGALLQLCDGTENGETDTERARQAYGRRLRQTPGVVATVDDPVRASLLISSFGEPGIQSPIIDAAFQALRDRWVTPYGHECMDGIEVWRHAREQALGIYRRWDPWPPQDWLDARSAWGKFVRGELAARRADSAHEVAILYPRHPLLAAWRAQEKKFRPNPVTVWLDDVVARTFAGWLHTGEEPGLCWTDAPEFGQRVAELAGVPYYGRKGLDKRGRLVDDERGPCVLSDMSNREGRNLQHFARNLVVSPMTSAKVWEQVVGRTHRTGQTHDTVTVEVYQGCLEHWASWQRAKSRARYTEQTTGQPQKILYADDTIEAPSFPGPRWNL
jgi:hypothetical protein